MSLHCIFICYGRSPPVGTVNFSPIIVCYESVFMLSPFSKLVFSFSFSLFVDFFFLFLGCVLFFVDYIFCRIMFFCFILNSYFFFLKCILGTGFIMFSTWFPDFFAFFLNLCSLNILKKNVLGLLSVFQFA